MNKEIITSAPAPVKAITIMEYQQRRYQRRIRVAKRMAKRWPMFAAEFMQDEFPGYQTADFIRDITPVGKPRKKQRFKRAKSPLKRMGRWPLVEKCMLMYASTGKEEFLIEAQQWRNKLYSRYELLFRIPGGTFYAFTFSPETPYKMVMEMAGFKGYENVEQLEEMVRHYCQYIPSAQYSGFIPEILKT